MDLLLHFVEHALEDTLSLVPFLFVTYLVLEALEHAAGNRVNAAVRRAGAAGPVIVLRSVYYPEEDAYALEQMGEATWTTHFRYGS